MKYKILKRIQNEQSTVGYQLLSEDGKILNIPKNQVMQAAYQGLVVNAIYNKHTKSLSGVAGTDLRRLPVIQYSEILSGNTQKVNGSTSKNSSKTKQTNSQYKTNHELAKEYILKQKALGKEVLKLELLSNDRVKLVEVLDKTSTGTFVMPSFITEHHTDLYKGPFKHCKFTKIVINSDYQNWKCLLSYMESTTISVHYSGKPINNLYGTFYGCVAAERIELNGLDTSQVTDMSCMFAACKALKKIDFSKFNTSCVTNMSEMFNCCESIDQLDLSSFDTSNVTDMSRMFEFCKSLKKLDISSFNTSQVTTMWSLLYGCESLIEIDLSRFNTSNVHDMKSMFQGCKLLRSLDLKAFDTHNVCDMSEMFSNCKSLRELDLSSFDTSNVKDVEGIFENDKIGRLIVSPKLYSKILRELGNGISVIVDKA